MQDDAAPCELSRLGQVRLQRALLAGRRPGGMGDGVEGDELARERDEGVTAGGHCVDDATLLGRELHEAIP